MCCLILQSVLVGLLSGSCSAGCLQLGDSTGDVLIASCFNRDTRRGGEEGECVSAQMGNILIVEEFVVVVERVILARQLGCAVTELFLPYLFPLRWRSVPYSSGREGTVELLARVKARRSCLFFVVLCKNSLVRSASTDASTQWYCDVEVMAHSNMEELASAITRGSLVKLAPISHGRACRYILHFSGSSVSWCPLLHYGCLYCLTTLHEEGSLPPPRECSVTITSNHSIELMEFSPRWQAGPPLLNVVDLIEKIPLPAFSVACTQCPPGPAMLVCIYKNDNCIVVHSHRFFEKQFGNLQLCSSKYSLQEGSVACWL